jgi:hypothetical protein
MHALHGSTFSSSGLGHRLPWHRVRESIASASQSLSAWPMRFRATLLRPGSPSGDATTPCDVLTSFADPPFFTKSWRMKRILPVVFIRPCRGWDATPAAGQGCRSPVENVCSGCFHQGFNKVCQAAHTVSRRLCRDVTCINWRCSWTILSRPQLPVTCRVTNHKV